MSQSIATEVTVVSANFNNGPYLQDYFESLLNSSVRPGACIICDDGSEDNSKEIIADYVARYDWIEAIYFPENKGVAHATNAALDQVKTQFILRLDPDDMLKPNRVKVQHRYMLAHPDVDVLGGNCEYFETISGKALHYSVFPSDSQGIIDRLRSGENGVLNGTTMIRTASLAHHRYRQEMVWAEDYDLFARLLHAGLQFAAQSEALTRVRIHDASATSNVAFDTIQKAHQLSVELFDNPKPKWKVRLNYFHIMHYRRYMMAENPLIRTYHLLIAAINRPDKVFKRFTGA